MRLSILLLALSAACAAAYAAAPDGEVPNSVGQTPHTGVPQELVGTWINGAVSATNFYNPATGSWSNGHGTGLFYRFNADGTFEYGWQEYANSYGCGERALVYKKGTVTVDAATHTVQVYPRSSVVRGESSCSASSNYEKPGPTAQETLIWDWAKDEYGHTYLLLRFPSTGFSWFYKG